jgi:hypothetical protein
LFIVADDDVAVVGDAMSTRTIDDGGWLLTDDDVSELITVDDDIAALDADVTTGVGCRPTTIPFPVPDNDVVGLDDDGVACTRAIELLDDDAVGLDDDVTFP